MKIHIDGIIYSLQKTGGISRYFNECLSRISRTDSNDINIILYKNYIGAPPHNGNIKFDYITKLPPPKIRPSRIFKPLVNSLNNYIANNYWKKINSGIFHSTYYTTYEKLKIPQVTTFYDMVHEKFPEYFGPVEKSNFVKRKKECAKNSSSIICISQNTKKDLMEIHSIDPKKIHVVYLGYNPLFKKIDEEKIKDNFLKTNNIKNPFILYVGSRAHYKNFKRFLEAINILDNKNIYLITAGGGEFQKDEKDLIKKLKMEKRVINFGFPNDEELNILYNCAAVFVYPSLYEGFGIPILEAMACGTPVAASDIPCFSEVGGKALIYFNPYNSNDIAKKIKQAIDEGNNSWRVKLGLERVKNFSWEKTAEETLKIYKLYE